MDPVHNHERNSDLTDNDSFDEANWVAIAWKREGTTESHQNGLWGPRDQDEIRRQEDLLRLPEPGTLQRNEGIDIGVTTIKSIASQAKSQLYKDLKSRQDVDSKSSRPSVKRKHLKYCKLSRLTSTGTKLILPRSSITQRHYNCNLGCNTLAFASPKDLRRHINDIHKTRTRYRCPADGCKYGGLTAGYSIKRKDNLRRHLRNIHQMHSTDLSDIDLERFLIMA
jgi:hypothetical protein